MGIERTKMDASVDEITSVLRTLTGHDVKHFAVAYMTAEGNPGQFSSFSKRSAEIGLYAEVIDMIAQGLYQIGDLK